MFDSKIQPYERKSYGAALYLRMKHILMYPYTLLGDKI